MLTLYFDCFSGISGDMILGALFDLGLHFSRWAAEMEKLRLPDASFEPPEKTSRAGLTATRFNPESAVRDSGHKHERRLDDILKIIAESGIDEDTKDRASAAFRRLALCEARIHGKKVQDVHFHELSGLDTIIDIVGAFVGIKMLGVEAFAASAVNVGSGTVNTAHGVLPVPAPATAALLEGAPVYSRFEGELTTPTGALLLTELTSNFGDIPLMALRASGFGAGGSDKEHPNVLRVLLGESAAPVGAGVAGKTDILYTVSTNVDDTEPRALGYLLERALELGAMDAWFEPVFMKKNRPGVVINILCNSELMDRAADLVIRETSTLGVRISPTPRICLDRRMEIVDTVFGPIRVKLALRDGRALRANPEYEDCARAARASGLPLQQVIDTARRIAEDRFVKPDNA
ncbi:MAG TPA: nickel pincer cofactor biosynthesis protein LarC [bacterium]|nr:nickel pincer cofactor biosynthesis protein LarC [bacterium]